MKTEFTEQLKRHLGFLERSCAAYDSGHQEEALRIAVSLRVLFHDTQHSSVSLLSHLGIKVECADPLDLCARFQTRSQTQHSRLLYTNVAQLLDWRAHTAS